MHRRAHLKAIFGSVAGFSAAVAQKTPSPSPIHLFVEMEVRPGREQEMIDNYHRIFLPEAKKHPGFISLRILKLRQAVQGPRPSINYRFELVYESEELRQKWISSPEHQRVWPTIERTLRDTKNYSVLLFDEI